MNTVEEILSKPLVKKYIEGIKRLNQIQHFIHFTHPLVEDLAYVAHQLTPMDIAVADWRNPEIEKNSGYITCVTSEWLLFDVCFLKCVTGSPPYEIAKDLRLDDDDIRELQQKWLDIGVNPAEIQIEKWTKFSKDWRQHKSV